MTRNIFTESLLSDEGINLTSSFRAELNKVLNFMEENSYSKEEIALMGDLMQKMVGDAVSKRLLKQAENSLFNMSDTEFECYLVSKYGILYRHSESLTKEELDRLDPIIDREVQKICEEMSEMARRFRYPKWNG